MYKASKVLLLCLYGSHGLSSENIFSGAAKGSKKVAKNKAFNQHLQQAFNHVTNISSLIPEYTEIQIHGLKSASGKEINGRRGFIKSYFASNDRYEVVLEWDKNKHEILGKKLKAANLKIISNTETNKQHTSWEDFIKSKDMETSLIAAQRMQTEFASPILRELNVNLARLNTNGIKKFEFHIIEDGMVGAFATQDIQKGEIILAEDPVLQTEFPKRQEIKIPRCLWEQYIKLDKTTQENILKLTTGINWSETFGDESVTESGVYNNIKRFEELLSHDNIREDVKNECQKVLDLNLSEEDKKTFNEVAAICGVNMTASFNKKFLFLEAARFNHSCNPNAYYSYGDVVEGKLTFVALRDIKAGEEIGWNYLSASAPLDDKNIAFFATVHRQMKLDEIFHFTCACSACRKEPAIPDEKLFKKYAGEKEVMTWDEYFQYMTDYFNPSAEILKNNVLKGIKRDFEKIDLRTFDKLHLDLLPQLPVHNWMKQGFSDGPQRARLGGVYARWVDQTGTEIMKMDPDAASRMIDLGCEILWLVEPIFTCPVLQYNLNNSLGLWLFTLGRDHNKDITKSDSELRDIFNTLKKRESSLSVANYKRYFVNYQKKVFSTADDNLRGWFVDRAVEKSFHKFLERNGVDGTIDFETFKKMHLKLPFFLARYCLDESYYWLATYFGTTRDVVMQYYNLNQNFLFTEFGHLL